MKRKTKLLMAYFMLGMFILNGPLRADDSVLLSKLEEMQQEMKKMSNTINEQNSRIRDLERRPQVQSAPASDGSVEVPPPMSDYEFNERLANATGGANKWLKDLSFKGDLRLRYESFQNTSGNPSETDDRNRFRYRLRYGFEKKFNDDMQVGFAMASGENFGATGLGDPTSTNTTFDNNFAFKQINIEKAYARYAPSFLRGYGPLTKTTITAGKMDNSFEKGSSDMIWDRDVKPEGAIETLDFNFIEGSDFNLGGWANFGQFVLDEDATHPSDSNLFAFQLGLNPVLYTDLMERPIDITTSASYYSYDRYTKESNFLIGTSSLARGNPNTAGAATSLDTGDFEIFEIYNEIAFYPGGMPIRPFFDYAHNFGNVIDDNEAAGIAGIGEDDAWGLGIKVGGILKKGDWELSYAYKRIGAHSVPGFNDSDFGYAGHSGKRGSVFKGAYALTDNISVNLAAFFVNNLNSGTGGILDEEQRRFQTDLVWKF